LPLNTRTFYELNKAISQTFSQTKQMWQAFIFQHIWLGPPIFWQSVCVCVWMGGWVYPTPFLWQVSLIRRSHILPLTPGRLK